MDENTMKEHDERTLRQRVEELEQTVHEIKEKIIQEKLQYLDDAKDTIQSLCQERDNLKESLLVARAEIQALITNVSRGTPEEVEEVQVRDQKAVVAAYGSNNGCVIWMVGGKLNTLINAYGPDDLESAQLNPPDRGIWIWEGTIIDHTPHGVFRRPTEHEWRFIKANRCPLE